MQRLVSLQDTQEKRTRNKGETHVKKGKEGCGHKLRSCSHQELEQMRSILPRAVEGAGPFRRWFLTSRLLRKPFCYFMPQPVPQDTDALVLPQSPR